MYTARNVIKITLQRYGDFATPTIPMLWHFTYQTFGICSFLPLKELLFHYLFWLFYLFLVTSQPNEQLMLPKEDVTTNPKMINI